MTSFVKRIFLVWFLYSSIPAVGQVNLDSLWSVWSDSTQPDTIRLAAIKRYSWDGYLYSQPDSAFYFAQLEYNFAKRKMLKKQMASALNTQGVSFWIRGDYPKGIDYYTRSATIKEEIGDKRGIAGFLNNIGIIYNEQGDHKKALDSYTQSLTIYEELGDDYGVALCLTNLGIVCSEQGNNARAIDYFTRSLALSEEMEDKKGVSNTLNHIGLIYNEQGDNERAIDYYTRSLTIREEIEDKRGVAETLNNFGLIYNERGDNAKAIAYYTRSLTLSEEIGDKKEISNSLSNIGNIFVDQGNSAYTEGNRVFSTERYVSAIGYHTRSLTIREEIGDKKGIAVSLVNLGRVYSSQGYANINSKGNAAQNYARAITYSNRGLSIAKEIGVAVITRDAANTLYEVYKGTGSYKLALEMHELYMAISDRIGNKVIQREAIRMEYKYAYEKEKQAIELEQQKKDAVIAEEVKKQKIVQNSLISGSILMSLLIFVAFLGFLQKRKANKILLAQKRKIEIKNLKLLDKNEKIKRHTDALKATNKKLKELDATKNLFFSIIAHDLRNPFNSLLGFSELLLENHTKYDDKKIEHHLKILFQGTRNTYKLLENLLTWSRSQLGQIKFSPEEINLKIVINEIMVSLEETAKKKDIKLINNTGNRLIVYADRNMINSILRNLILNAIKFTLKGGEISLKARTVIDEDNYKFTEITVKDNGVGISSEIQSNLFKITKNVSTAGTEKEKGTGLGLILCDEFVSRHDGKIWVESEVGKGSEFVFTLPLVKNI